MYLRFGCNEWQELGAARVSNPAHDAADGLPPNRRFCGMEPTNPRFEHWIGYNIYISLKSKGRDEPTFLSFTLAEACD